MSTENKLEITAAIAMYAYGFDTRDAKGFADVFTEDGTLEFYSRMSPTPEQRLHGRTAISDWAAGRFKLHGPDSYSRHFQTGTVFDELTDASARTRTMLLLTRQAISDPSPVVMITGIYHDQWRKTPDGWKMAVRSLRHDNPGAFVTSARSVRTSS